MSATPDTATAAVPVAARVLSTVVPWTILAAKGFASADSYLIATFRPGHPGISRNNPQARALRVWRARWEAVAAGQGDPGEFRLPCEHPGLREVYGAAPGFARCMICGERPPPEFWDLPKLYALPLLSRGRP